MGVVDVEVVVLRCTELLRRSEVTRIQRATQGADALEGGRASRGKTKLKSRDDVESELIVGEVGVRFVEVGEIDVGRDEFANLSWINC